MLDKETWRKGFFLLSVFFLIVLRPCPNESRHFWNRIFFVRIRVDRASNLSGERFKKMRFRYPNSLVSCERRADSCKKLCSLTNVLIRVNMALPYSHAWFLHDHLKPVPLRCVNKQKQKKQTKDYAFRVKELPTAVMFAIFAGFHKQSPL